MDTPTRGHLEFPLTISRKTILEHAGNPYIEMKQSHKTNISLKSNIWSHALYICRMGEKLNTKQICSYPTTIAIG